MAGDPRNPEVGEVVIDASELAASLVDLPPGGQKGMVATQDGFLAVLQEIVAQHASFGDKAGVTKGDMATLLETTATIAGIDRFLLPVAKLYELLVETRALADDRRQRTVLAIGDSVGRRARHCPELLSRYEKTRAYRAAAAKKGWDTRRKNAAAKASPDAPK